MRDIIIDLQKSYTCKVQLTIAINVISSKGVDADRVMHSKSDNIELLVSDDANDVADELYESFLWRYQIVLETSMRGSSFISHSFQL